MSWPLASHFSAMLQNPRVAFRDPRLQRTAIEKNGQNQPRPWAGAFAVVYKGIDPDNQGPFAVRVFTSESPERRERYDLISAYLKDRKLRCLVDFEYRDNAIRSAGDGKWYPLIVMEWVQGETLFQWLQARSLEGNREAIAQVADRWLEAVQELSDARLAHGDLQHANVMVTPAGEIKLVDYDGMCVPALVGRRNLEVGIEPYQHPGRNATTLLSPDLDNFSALSIYVALRALALQPGLWLKYVEQPGYDRLLFRREDFEAPAQSPLGYELAALGDADLGALAGRLFALAQGRIEEVPPLGQLVNSYVQVERLLLARQWDAAVDLLNRRGHFRDAPAHLQPLIQQAYEHVCRQQAWTKFARIPAEVSKAVDRQLVESWNEALFTGFALAEAQRQRVTEARRRVQIMDRLRNLVQRTAGKVTVEGEKGLAVLAAQLPADYPRGLRQRVELARRRAIAFTRLERALAKPAGEAAIAAAWQGIVEAKGEAMVSLDMGMRIALAEERAAVLQALARIPRNAPLDERDRQVLAAWNDQLMADCPEAEKWRPVYQMAAARQEVLKRLQAAIESHDEAGIVQWAGKRRLAKYPLPEAWTAAIDEARDRIARVEALLDALRDAVEGSPLPSGEGRGVRAGEDLALPGATQPSAAESGSGTEYPVPSTSPVPGERDAEPAAADGENPPPAASALWQRFDVRLLRAYADRFAPYQAFLSDWIRRELLPQEKLGLALAENTAGAAPVEDPEGHYRLCWSWPEERLADQCIVAVLAAEPGAADEPEGAAALWRAAITRAEWSEAGGSRVIPVQRAWEGSCVVVWAIVDAGFARFHSSPLVLGRIQSGRQWKWPRIFSNKSG